MRACVRACVRLPCIRDDNRYSASDSQGQQLRYHGFSSPRLPVALSINITAAALPGLPRVPAAATATADTTTTETRTTRPKTNGGAQEDTTLHGGNDPDAAAASALWDGVRHCTALSEPRLQRDCVLAAFDRNGANNHAAAAAASGPRLLREWMDVVLHLLSLCVVSCFSRIVPSVFAPGSEGARERGRAGGSEGGREGGKERRRAACQQTMSENHSAQHLLFPVSRPHTLLVCRCRRPFAENAAAGLGRYLPALYGALAPARALPQQNYSRRQCAGTVICDVLHSFFVLTSSDAPACCLPALIGEGGMSLTSMFWKRVRPFFRTRARGCGCGWERWGAHLHAASCWLSPGACACLPAMMLAAASGWM